MTVYEVPANLVCTTVFRSCSVPRLPGLRQYIDAIGDDFCPLLWPSRKRGLIRNSVYQLSGGEAGIADSIFYLGVLHTELLRHKRRWLKVSEQILVCENLFFRFEDEDIVNGEQLFAWPHWTLKKHYTSYGLMFGKFWKGELQKSIKGKNIPPPPYHMLSIRSAVKPRDPAFFVKAPELKDLMLNAEDQGGSPLSHYGLDEDFFVRLLGGGFTPEQMLETLQASNVYAHLRELEGR
jgi:hypothetical protein